MSYNEYLKDTIERELDIKLMSFRLSQGIPPNPKMTVILNYTPLFRKSIELHTPIAKVAAEIIENKIEDLDIVEYVKNAFVHNNDFNCLEIDLGDSGYYHKKDIRKINVEVDFDTHRKLRIISAIQDNTNSRSEFNVVSTIPHDSLYSYEMENREKQRTVILDKNVLSTLKITASERYSNFSEAVSTILENKFANLDVIGCVKKEFTNGSWLDVEVDNTIYDLYDEIYNAPSNDNVCYPNKQRINLNINPDTHKKLRIISAIRGKPLDRIVNLIIGFEIGLYKKNEILSILNECTWYYNSIEKIKSNIKI